MNCQVLTFPNSLEDKRGQPSESKSSGEPGRLCRRLPTRLSKQPSLIIRWSADEGKPRTSRSPSVF